MPGETLNLLVQRVTQPIGVFYVGVIPATVLRRNARVEPRAIVDADETIVGIQRALNDERVKEIRQYLHTVDASFPNSIILSLDPARLVRDPEAIAVDGADVGLVRLVVEESPDAFTVIDGQHRLKGFDDASAAEFQLIISIFIGLDEEDKAYLFSTINSKQAKVNRSIVYDLFDVAEHRSPQRSAHDIVKALNSDPDSPFYKRIKLLGTNPKFENSVLYHGVLSQGTFVERLLALMTRNAAVDRDVIRRNGKPDSAEGDTKLVFRKMWIDGRDDVILKILSNFFRAVRDVFPDDWGSNASPLARTIGLGALVGLLGDLIPIGTRNGDLSESFFKSEMQRVRRGYESLGPPLTFESFPAAGSGEAKLLSRLRDWREAGIG